MNSTFSRKKPVNEETENNGFEAMPSKRRRSLSPSAASVSSGASQPDDVFSPSTRAPPSAYDLDRLNYHITLQDFGSELQKASNAILPGDQLSRYEKVDVILLSWEEEDPKLPVSIEIKELAEIFRELYGYEVEEWFIPAENCHNRLQARILEFLGDGDPRHLKIVYYAGHGKLTNHGQPAWTSRRNRQKDRCPTVKWSGIQNTLEESRSDVLIILDCCSSGVCTTDEGNGVTELIAACAYNAIANGVGPFSFTHALNTKLRQMAQLPYFTIGYLYNAIFTEIQGWRLEDSRHRKVPVHLVLSQNPKMPRSIRLSTFSKGKARTRSNRPSSPPPSGGSAHSQSLDVPPPLESPQTSSLAANSTSPFSQGPSPSSGTSLSNLPEYPRLLLSIRLNEDVKPNELSTELFADWIRSVPISASLVRVEAGFANDSTLVILSMPPALLGYLPLDPAITLLGTIRSRNILAQPQEPPAFAADIGLHYNSWMMTTSTSYDSGVGMERDQHLIKDDSVAHDAPPDPQNCLLSPGQSGSSPPSTPGAQTDEAETTSVYSLPADPQNHGVLAKMKPAHLSLDGSMFGGNIPEDIGYEIYKLGTRIQALNPRRPEIDIG